MPITWRNINTPSDAAALETATRGLNQVATGVNSIFNRYAQREDSQNEQNVATNAAMFEKRLREANPQEQEALLQELSRNPQVFGNQSDELTKLVLAEPERRQRQALTAQQLVNQQTEADRTASINAARPYLETINELSTQGDYTGIKNYLGIGAENTTPEQQAEYAKRTEALKAAGEYDTVLGVVRRGDIFDATTTLFNEESTPEEMTALLDQQFNGLSAEEKEQAQARINDMVQYRDKEGVHSSDAKFIAEQKEKYLREFEGRLIDLERREEELAAYKGMTANPELAAIFTQSGKVTPSNFATIAKSLPVNDDADYEEMGNDLHTVYTELLDDPENKLSPEQLKYLMMDSLTNPGVIKVKWLGDNTINKERLKEHIESGFTDIGSRLNNYRDLKDIQAQRQEIQNVVNERVKTLTDAASENYSKYKVGRLKGKNKDPYGGFDFSSLDLSTPSILDVARDVAESKDDDTEESKDTNEEGSPPPSQAVPEGRQFWPNVRW